MVVMEYLGPTVSSFGCICTLVQSFFLWCRNNTSYKEDLSLFGLIRTKKKTITGHVYNMGGRRLVGLFLLLWMALTASGEEELMNRFIQDVISTFQLTSPTIIYDSDEAPGICYADQRVLCLLITEGL